MILSALKYTRSLDEPREWSIVGRNGDYAYFDNINLLVGKNSSGKSRTLNVIREIANLLADKIDLRQSVSPSERFELAFTQNVSEYKYILTFKNRIVVDEVLSLDGKILLDRNKGVLLNVQGERVSFEVEDYQLVVNLKSSAGDFYFSDLVAWGQSLKNYLFASQLEKNRLVKDYTQIEGDDRDIDDPDVLIYTFHKGKLAFGDAYISEIIADMQSLGYDISDINIEEEDEGYGLYIEEDNGEYAVSQREMSQGLFRALSLFIMLNYIRLSDQSLCLLIDDVGEGLDFDSSKRLIDIIVKKVNKSNIQFFLTTNSRQVMNQVRLRYWTVIGREHRKSIFYDYKNSKEIFDDFKYTGLNNFDFLVTDFFRKGFGLIDEDND